MKLYDKNLHSFSGWLIVFLIICLINIFFSVVTTASDIMTLIKTLNTEYITSSVVHRIAAFTNTSHIICDIIILLSFIMIVFLLKNKSSLSPRKIIRWLIIIFIVTAFYILLNFARIQDNFSNRMRAFINILAQAVFTVIWVSYFYKSKRVKEYFGENKEVNNNENK